VTTSSSSATSPATPPTPAETPSGTPTVTPTIGGSPLPSSAAQPAECPASSLRLRAKAAGVAAGTDYISLIVTNVGGSACLLVGYPGASFLDAHGQPVGLPAARDRSSSHPRVVVKPGDAAHATLSYPNPAYFGSGCGETHAKAVRFYPPDQTQSLQAAIDADVCTDRNGRSMVRAMRPGSKGS
jgi:hypothetical protein